MKTKHQTFRHIGFFLAAFLALGATSCAKHAPVEPSSSSIDTTSHKFVWKIDTLGGYSSSLLNDVAILSATEAYAVGDMYVKDTTGKTEPFEQNMARWDGTHWKLASLPIPYPGGAAITPLYGVWASSALGLWVADGLVETKDGSGIWHQYDPRILTGRDSLSVTCAWGNSSTGTMYFGGLAGSLSRFDGTTWRWFESGTRQNIADLWGGSHPLWGTNVCVALASSRAVLPDTRFIVMDPAGTLTSVPFDEPRRSLVSLWFSSSAKRSYVCGDGIYAKAPGDAAWTRITEVPGYYMNKIRGNNENDLFAVGDFGMVVHYNGMSWHTYPEVALNAGSYLSVAVLGDDVFAVGFNTFPSDYSMKAVIAHGRRIK